MPSEKDYEDWAFSVVLQQVWTNESVLLVGQALAAYTNQACTVETREMASKTYPWAHHHFITNSGFRRYFKLGSDGDPEPKTAAGEPFSSALHPAIFGKFSVPGKRATWRLSGLMLIWCLLLQAARRLHDEIESAAEAGTCLPTQAYDRASLPDASRSRGWGVYRMQTPDRELSERLHQEPVQIPADIQADGASRLELASRYLGALAPTALGNLLGVEALFIAIANTTSPRFGGNAYLTDASLSLLRPTPLSSFSYLRAYRAEWKDRMTRKEYNKGRTVLLPLDTDKEFWGKAYLHCFAEDERDRMNPRTLQRIIYNIHRLAVQSPELGIPSLGDVWPIGLPRSARMYFIEEEPEKEVEEESDGGSDM